MGVPPRNSCYEATPSEAKLKEIEDRREDTHRKEGVVLWQGIGELGEVVVVFQHVVAVG